MSQYCGWTDTINAGILHNNRSKQINSFVGPCGTLGESRQLGALFVKFANTVGDRINAMNFSYRHIHTHICTLRANKVNCNRIDELEISSWFCELNIVFVDCDNTVK